jgi:hypothetical protein
MALAYTWVASLGTEAIRQPKLRVELSQGKAWRHSVFHRGLYILTQWLQWGRRLFYPFGSYPTSANLSKSVAQ